MEVRRILSSWSPPISILLTTLVVSFGAAAFAQGSGDKQGVGGSERTTALAADGSILRIVQGSFGELFPGDHPAAKAKNPALALDILYSDRKVRQPIPGTQGPEIESSPSLIYERSSNTTYVVWASRFNFVHTRINLISLTGTDSWSEVIEISGDPFSLKTAPSLAVTREETASAEDPSQTVERTVLHTIWWEESGDGNRVVYAPLVLENGVYEGQNSVVPLQGFTSTPSSVTTAATLARSPSVTTSSDGRSVYASYIDPDTARFVTLRLTMAPDEFLSIANQVEALLAQQASQLCARGGATALADAAFDLVIEAGRATLPDGLLSYLAHDLRSHVEQQGCSSGTQRIASDARSHIVLVGIRAGGDGLLRVRSDARSHIVLVGLRSRPGSDRTAAIERIADRDAPHLGAGPVRTFLSRDGRSAIVSWQPNASLIRYRETRSDGDEDWGPAFSLVLDAELTEAEAYHVLEQRINSRR